MSNYGEMGTKSISIDIRMIQKASENSEYQEALFHKIDFLLRDWNRYASQCVDDGMHYMAAQFYEEDNEIHFGVIASAFPFEAIHKKLNGELSDHDDIAEKILEEFEKKKQEGLFAMMDKIHENSEELKEQIETEEKGEFFLEQQKMEKYEKSFLFEEENTRVVL